MFLFFRGSIVNPSKIRRAEKAISSTIKTKRRCRHHNINNGNYFFPDPRAGDSYYYTVQNSGSSSSFEAVLEGMWKWTSSFSIEFIYVLGMQSFNAALSPVVSDYRRYRRKPRRTFRYRTFVVKLGENVCVVKKKFLKKTIVQQHRKRSKKKT